MTHEENQREYERLKKEADETIAIMFDRDKTSFKKFFKYFFKLCRMVIAADKFGRGDELVNHIETNMDAAVDAI